MRSAEFDVFLATIPKKGARRTNSRRHFTVADALDPLPDTLLTFLDRGSARFGKRSKDATVLTNVLKGLGGLSRSWGSLGLSLSDVHKNRPFDCKLCQDAKINNEPQPQMHYADPTGRRYSHGFRKGEGQLLRTYADGIGFPEEKWPAWLRSGP